MTTAARTYAPQPVEVPLQRPFQTDDASLRPIAGKVLAAQRLNFDDGVALYRSHDILAVGWLANFVREKLHGDVTYFNVNRHINPTNVCVAACRLCAFGRKKGADGAYTMALEQAWETAASGYSGRAYHAARRTGRHGPHRLAGSGRQGYRSSTNQPRELCYPTPRLTNPSRSGCALSSLSPRPGPAAWHLTRTPLPRAG